MATKTVYANNIESYLKTKDQLLSRAAKWFPLKTNSTFLSIIKDSQREDGSKSWWFKQKIIQQFFVGAFCNMSILHHVFSSVDFYLSILKIMMRHFRKNWENQKLFFSEWGILIQKKDWEITLLIKYWRNSIMKSEGFMKNRWRWVYWWRYD